MSNFFFQKNHRHVDQFFSIDECLRRRFFQAIDMQMLLKSYENMIERISIDSKTEKRQWRFNINWNYSIIDPDLTFSCIIKKQKQYRTSLPYSHCLFVVLLFYLSARIDSVDRRIDEKENESKEKLVIVVIDHSSSFATHVKIESDWI